MQRNIQFLLLLAAISMVFASTYEFNGCRVGKVFSMGCVKCECVNGKPQCLKQTQNPCVQEGSQLEFFTYPEIQEPPRAKDVQKKYEDSNFDSSN